MPKSPLISIVAPVYNEEAVVERFYKTLKRVTKKITKYRFEIILVDDGSSDRSLIILKYLSLRDQAVKTISLSRNFGHQIAMVAGLDHASGDAVITLDSDLQDPPKEIINLIKKWEQGAEIVLAERISRQDPFFVKFFARLFYQLQKDRKSVV